MESLRKCTFETNSSSCHSITFEDDEAEDQDELYFKVLGEGDFGWTEEYLTDPLTKMNYALIAYSYMCESPEDRKSVFDEIKRVFSNHGVTVDFNEDAWTEKPAIYFEKDSWEERATAHTAGYIDHQSVKRDDVQRLALMFKEDPDSLYHFVFGKSVIHTDNDNH